jgi:glycosyltransferase involved in cell wall biosynthesis
MLESSGIGMIIKNVIPHILDRYQWHLLVNQDSFEPNQWAHDLPHTVVNTPIYSVKEQLLLGAKIPKSAVLTWFPHYNVPIAIDARCRYVVNINDCFHRAFYDTLTLPQKFYARWVMAAAAHKAQRIITISDFSEQQIRSYTGVQASKIDTILLAADTAHFSQSYRQDQLVQIRAKYRLPDQYILFVGNLKPHKNLARLLQAFASLKAKGQTGQTKLVLCGNFKGFITGMDNLDSLISNLGLEDDVVLPGFVDNQDLPAIYQMALGFAFPSYYEGFGLPLLEAMAAHVPVISSHAASLPEVGGDAVRYFDPMSLPSIEEAIKTLIADAELRKSLMQKGWERQNQFSWQKAAGQFAAVFDQVIHQH